MTKLIGILQDSAKKSGTTSVAALVQECAAHRLDLDILEAENAYLVAKIGVDTAENEPRVASDAMCRRSSARTGARCREGSSSASLRGARRSHRTLDGSFSAESTPILTTK